MYIDIYIVKLYRRHHRTVHIHLRLPLRINKRISLTATSALCARNEKKTFLICICDRFLFRAYFKTIERHL